MTVTGECVWFTEESMKLLDLRLFTISCVCSLPQVKDLLRGKRSTVWTPSPIPACIYRSPRIQGLFISQMYESVQKKFIRYAGIFASPLSPLHWSSLISFSNQWRESHTGDTDVCPEASADPRHADPLALSRPHAWPAQGTAAFPSTTLLQRPVVVLFFAINPLFSSWLLLVTSVTCSDWSRCWFVLCCIPLQPPHTAPHSTGFCCNADFLSRALSPHITLVLISVVFSPPFTVAPNTA